jgi:hypothetical protein
MSTKIDNKESKRTEKANITFQDQLKSKVIGITSFSKMAIVLFRFLYKEEEYAGKSLTGNASKRGEKRPPVDQEKLTGIYCQCFFFLLFWLWDGSN